MKINADALSIISYFFFAVAVRDKVGVAAHSFVFYQRARLTLEFIDCGICREVEGA